MDETIGKRKWQKQSINGRTICKQHKQSVIFTDYSMIIICKQMKQSVNNRNSLYTAETVCKYTQLSLSVNG